MITYFVLRNLAFVFLYGVVFLSPIGAMEETEDENVPVVRVVQQIPDLDEQDKQLIKQIEEQTAQLLELARTEGGYREIVTLDKNIFDLKEKLLNKKVQDYLSKNQVNPSKTEKDIAETLIFEYTRKYFAGSSHEDNNDHFIYFFAKSLFNSVFSHEPDNGDYSNTREKFERIVNDLANQVGQESLQLENVNEFQNLTIFVPQEGVHLASAQGQFPVVGTRGLASCVGVILYDPTTKIAALSHFDSGTNATTEIPRILSKLEAHQVNINNLQVFLIGGHQSTMHAIYENLICYGINNIKFDYAGESRPVANDSILFDTRTGQLYFFSSKDGEQLFPKAMDSEQQVTLKMMEMIPNTYQRVFFIDSNSQIQDNFVKVIGTYNQLAAK